MHVITWHTKMQHWFYTVCIRGSLLCLYPIMDLKKVRYPSWYYQTELYSLIFFSHFAFSQECPILLMEGQCPAEFSSSTLGWKFLMSLKTLISWFRCVSLGLELNFAGQWPSRNRLGHPCHWAKFTDCCDGCHSLCVAHFLLTYKITDFCFVRILLESRWNVLEWE